MAPLTQAQLDAVSARLRQLSRPSLRVTDVDADDVEGPDGAAVVVTVRLASTAGGPEWDADDFLALRREARTAALDALPGQHVRVTYESAASDETVDDEGGAVGDKLATEGDR